MPIFLIGFMCAGKTTLGAPLARALDYEFIDLDDLVEQKAGMTVKQLFASKGESEFRRIERETLSEVCSKGKVIVACGGGTPCQPGLMDMMNASGTTVWLMPSRQRLATRLMLGKHKRPLIAHLQTEEEMMEFVDKMMDDRAKWYEKAQWRFDSSQLENDAEIKDTIDQFISQICSTSQDSVPSPRSK